MRRPTRPSWRASRSSKIDVLVPKEPSSAGVTSVLNGATSAKALLEPGDTFPRRHIGPSEDEVREMLALLGLPSLDALVAETVPEAIRLREPLHLEAPLGESAALAELRARAGR